MKKSIYTALALMLCFGAMAQDKPGVGINQKRVDKSAILDIAAKNKGVLIPRVAINDVKVFGLDGDSKTESLLVYNNNNTGSVAKGFYYWTTVKYVDNGVEKTRQQWELITSDSVLNEKITEVKKYVKDEVTKITQIGNDATNLSYLVAFKPDGKDSSTGAFTYLVPNAPDATGKITYEQKNITLKDLVASTESNTFVKEYKHKVKDPKDATKEIEVIKEYRYFGEKVISDWLKADKANTVANIPDEKGTLINVVGAVSGNLSQIFNENKDVINKYITEGANNVYVKKDGDTYNLYFKDEKGDVVKVDVNALETKTDIQKGIIDANGKESGYAAAALDPAKVKPGQVIFKYTGEEIDPTTKKRKEYFLVHDKTIK